MLMALAWTVIRSGALWSVAHLRRVPNASRLLVFAVLMTLSGVCTLTGCYLSRTIDQATADDVNNRSFAFTNGAVFHSALANVSTTLSFSDNATTFTLSSGSGTATGTNRFDSCILTVTTSTYSVGGGPQVNDVITLDPCDFNGDLHTLTVSNNGATATSSAATSSTGSGGNANQATASQVNNHSFTFANGAVFHSGLTNISTALSFTNNAAKFSLVSGGGTVTGTNRFGSCILTVNASTYSRGDGPQENDVINLNPCNFDSTNNTLTVSNGSITVTSAAATVVAP